jgi:hypothetical protein
MKNDSAHNKVRTYRSQHNTGKMHTLFCSPSATRTHDVWDRVVTMGEFRDMTLVTRLRHVKAWGNLHYSYLTHYVNAWNERIIGTMRPSVRLLTYLRKYWTGFLFYWGKYKFLNELDFIRNKSNIALQLKSNLLIFLQMVPCRTYSISTLHH